MRLLSPAQLLSLRLGITTSCASLHTISSLTSFFYIYVFSLIIHYFPSLLLSAPSLYFLTLCCHLFLFNICTMQSKSKKGQHRWHLCPPIPLALLYFPANPAFVLAAFCGTWGLVCTEHCITQGDSDFACGL